MKVERLILGYLDNNVYILKKNGQSLIIDPSDEYEKIKDIIKGTKLLAVLVTHNHSDHIGALDEVINDNNVKEPIYKNNMEIGPFKFKTIETPGHTSDSKTFYFEEENIMFTGDFIFKSTIGRTDLDTGNYNVMMDSIKKIKKYPNCTIYPGHGDKTTLEEEKKNNVYF